MWRKGEGKLLAERRRAWCGRGTPAPPLLLLCGCCCGNAGGPSGIITMVVAADGDGVTSCVE